MNRNYRPIISLSLLVLAAVSGTAAAQAPVYEAGSGSLEDRVTRLERMMEARNQLLTETQQQLMSLQGEMDQLRGSLERSEYQLNQAVERQRQLYQELDNVSAQNKQAADTATTDAPATATAPAAKAAAPAKDVVVSDNAVENQAYDAAVQLVLRDKQYDKAITAFQDFIAKYPKSVYRPNAHYWLGQLLFSQKRTDEAAAQFAAVVKDFPKSPKRADAMLKLGVIAQEKGDVAGAKTVFQQIISAYPTSSSAKMAKSRLAALGG
ncbi:tol-pal system protein YbgF [Plesiomonas shigelloides]|uniref:tol-pal system protein YbgF n=1 Tax=Plesiomonas shigelloides TaxID=703 RepID=UPI001262058F|nr:tol-pal system protein YbgF [Plesiomonas shigelloides]KAB7659155.1 tol-pal system protein YbgF [Plesiomonas shigelloides]